MFPCFFPRISGGSYFCCFAQHRPVDRKFLPRLSIQSLSAGVLRRRVIDLIFYASRSRTNHVFPLLFNDPRTTTKVRDFSTWNTQMVVLLTRLIGRLSETVGVWDEFYQTEIGYFLDNGGPLTASSTLEESVVVVDRAFSKLRLHLRKLENLETELCKGNPQGVSLLPGSNFEGKMYPPA